MPERERSERQGCKVLQHFLSTKQGAVLEAARLSCIERENRTCERVGSGGRDALKGGADACADTISRGGEEKERFLLLKDTK